MSRDTFTQLHFSMYKYELMNGQVRENSNSCEVLLLAIVAIR
jgi:hypothetical protein